MEFAKFGTDERVFPRRPSSERLAAAIVLQPPSTYSRVSPEYSRIRYCMQDIMT